MGSPELVVLPKLIVGLGNPGKEYAGTRHNVGFMIVDQLAAWQGEHWTKERRWHCHIARTSAFTMIKPTTFMNRSGRAVAAVSRFFKVPPVEILVIYDDLDLPLGRLRIRPSGSAGGHNGIRSILEELGTDEFARLKVGIGRSSSRRDVVDHVLGTFDEGDLPVLEIVLEEAVKQVRLLLSHGVLEAMNRFNGKRILAERASQPIGKDEKSAQSKEQNED